MGWDRDLGRAAAVELDIAAERCPDLTGALAYWQSRRGQRFAPRRADIDPVDLVGILPRVMLADVLPGGEFRYRLSGTAIRAKHGLEMTGRSPRELAPTAYGALIHRHYSQGVARRRPMLHAIGVEMGDWTHSYLRLLLPLSEDGQTVTMLMAIDSREQDSPELQLQLEAAHGRF